MKKIIAMLLALAMVIGWIAIPPTKAHAAEPEVDWETHLTFELNEDGKSYGVSAYDGSRAGALTIPDTFNGLPVTAIGSGAFEFCDKLTEVTIPNSVTSIGTYAFHKCSSLTSVKIPDSVSSIGNYAFGSCGSLESVTIPKGVTSIQNRTFSECYNLRSVTIPESVTVVRASAFYGCKSLTDVYYAGTQKQWESVIIGGDNDSLLNANITFNGESSTEPVIPEANWEDCLVFEMNADGASYKVCYWQNKPVGMLTIPATYEGLPVTVIGGEAFADCTDLVSIIIPDSVNRIVTSAFRNCWGLTSVTISDSVMEIGSSAFADCVNLTDVYYDGSYEQWKSVIIGENNDPLSNANMVFAAEDPAEPTAPNVEPTAPSVEPTEAPTEPSLPTVDWGSYLTFTLNESGDSYSVGANNETAMPYMDVLEIPAEYNGLPVTGIYDRAFYFNGDFGTVSIPDGVTYIGASAFAGRSNLRSITFPDSVTTIGDRAFSNCTYLNSVSFGNGIAEIGKEAFTRCQALNYVNITDVAAWCKVSFASNTSNPLYYLQMTLVDGVPTQGLRVNDELVTELKIPEGVTAIADYAFYRCPGFLTVTIPGSVEAIGRHAFNNCKPLNTVTISDGVTSIGVNAFTNCTYLTTMYISDSVTNIDRNAFAGCTALETIYFSGSVGQWEAMSIDTSNDEVLGSVNIVFGKGDVDPNLSFTLNADQKSYCVTDCDENAAGVVMIPDIYNGLPVTAIGEDAFSNCEKMTNVIIPLGVTSIGRSAFVNCYNLYDVDIPDGVTVIEDGTFSGCNNLVKAAIPQSVTVIGNGAFMNCSSLTDAPITENIIAIGMDAFYGCNALTSLIIPEGITTIYDMTFSGCEGLNSVTLPNTIRTISYSAFGGCTNLTDVYYNGSEAQWTGVTVQPGNESLLSANIVYLEEPGKPSDPLTYEIWDDYVCIKSCDPGFSGYLEIPAEYEGRPVTTVNDGAFQDCAGLTGIYIPDTITVLGNSTFRGCSSLTDIVLPSGLAYVGNSMFVECSALQTITMPGTVSSIGSYAFAGCVSLHTIYFMATHSEWESMSIDPSNEGMLSTVYIMFCGEEPVAPTGPSVDPTWAPSDPTDAPIDPTWAPSDPTDAPIDPTWAPSDPTDAPIDPTWAPIDPTGAPTDPSVPSMPEAGWYNYMYFMPNEDGQSYYLLNCDRNIGGVVTIPATYNALPVTAIGEESFTDCDRLTGVIISEGITTIGRSAFARSYALTSVVIPEGVTVIESRTFEGCSALNSVKLPNSLSVIESYAFYDCDALYTLQLPDGLVAIAESAFYSCDSLSEIQIPDSVDYIGAEAFSFCPLDGIWVGENNQTYANDENGFLFSKDMTYLHQAAGAFEGSYTIPDGVVTVGAYAFTGVALTEIIFPDSVGEIGNEAFAYCDLREVVLGSGITYIEGYAFRGNENLTAITISRNVNYIGEWAFENCPVTIHCYIGSYAALYAGGMAIPVKYLDTVREMSLVSLPDKLTYPVDGKLKLDGLCLDVLVEDGTESGTWTTIYSGYTVGEYDFSTAGTKTITVSVGDLSVSFEVVVDADLVEYPESDHPYGNNSNATWVYTHKTDADMLRVTFSDLTRTEQGWDFVIICDSEGNEKYYSGTELTGKTIVVRGNSFTIRLTSDGSVTEYGFAIVAVEAVNLVDWESALTFALSEDGDSYIVTDCDDTVEGILEIPAVYNGLRVRVIGDNAFANCTGLTEIVLPGEATVIGSCAFQNCSNLKEITIPLSVCIIEDNAFLGCDALTQVYYGGNRKQWNAIEMGENNTPLTNAQIQFSQEGCEHTPGRTEVMNEWGGGSCLDTKYQDVITYCADCDAQMGRQTVIIPPTGHKAGEPVMQDVVEPGCNYSGYYRNVVHCTVCGCELSSEMVYVNPVGHTAGEPQLGYIWEANCTTSGYRDWNIDCTVCGERLHRIREEIPAKGHTPGDEYIEMGSEPSCTSNGYLWRTHRCVDCNTQIDSVFEIIPAKGHTPGEAIVEYSEEATCRSNGYRWKVQYCVDCNVSLDAVREIIPATEHLPGEPCVEEFWEATCTSNGKRQTATYCQYCGERTGEEVEIFQATGHKPGEPMITEEYIATCTSAGHYEKWIRCENANCGILLSRELVIVPMLDHTEQIIPGYAATCTEPGMTDGKQCTVCWQMIELQQEIPALGHTPGEPVIENQNEYTYESVSYCVVCGTEVSRETVVIGCTHTNINTTTDTVPPTCTEPGTIVITYICLDCGEILGGEGDEIPAMGHTPGDQVIENETNTSYDSVFYCVNCGNELSRETVTVACRHLETTKYFDELFATCVEPGLFAEVTACVICGEELSRIEEEIPALGHTAGEAVVENETDASYDSVIYCATCGAELSRETINKIPAAPVATVDGSKVSFDLGSAQKITRVYVFYVDGQEIADIQNWSQLQKAAANLAEPYGGKFYDCNTADKWNNLDLPKNGTYVLRMQYVDANGTTKTLSQQVEVTKERAPAVTLDGTKLVFNENYGSTPLTEVYVFWYPEAITGDIQNWSVLKSAAEALENSPYADDGGFKKYTGEALKNILISKAGEYVIRMVYIDANGVEQKLSQRLNMLYVPTASVDETDVIIDNNGGITPVDKVFVYYVGETVIKDLNDYKELQAAGSQHPEINLDGYYTDYSGDEVYNISVPVKGNYVLRIQYKDTEDGNATKVVTQQLRVDFTVSIVNGKIRFDEMADVTLAKVHLFYVGDSEIVNVQDWNELKTVGLNYSYVNGINVNGQNGVKSFPTAYTSLRDIKPVISGNYVIRVEYYIDGVVKEDGTQIRHILSKRFALEQGPEVSLVDGKLDVKAGVYTIDTITAFYVGDKTVANPTFENLKKAAANIEGSPYGEIGYKAMVDMDVIASETLTVPGNYVLRVSYKTAAGESMMMIVELTV